MTGWTWTVLSDGFTEAPEAILMSGGSWRRRLRLPATAVLLEHGSHGRVLFDTGYSARFFEETSRWPYRLYRTVTPVTLTEPAGIAGVLGRRGVPPESVEHVIVSHWHADHVGGLRDFPRATLLSHLEGWESTLGLEGLDALRKAYLPGLVPEDASTRLRWLREGDDVFGDGTMTVFEFPGHAAGQIGVRFVDAAGRAVLLAADACWLSDAFREMRLPHRVAGILHDRAAYGRSLARLHDLHRAEPDLLIVPCHCPETAARMPEP